MEGEREEEETLSNTHTVSVTHYSHTPLGSHYWLVTKIDLEKEIESEL